MAAATFQSGVNITLGFGIPGELIVDGPQRVDSLILGSAGGTIGLAFTKSNSTNVATMGGTIVNGTSVFAGILVNPKTYALDGYNSSGTLDPSMLVPPYSQGEFLTMGTIVVNIVGSANIGDLVQYNNTTGVLSAVVPGGTVTTGNTFIPNCVIWNYPTSATGLTAIRITN